MVRPFPLDSDFIPLSPLIAFLTFSPVLFSGRQRAHERKTMIVTATPQNRSWMYTCRRAGVIEGEDMGLATPRVNLFESLA